MHRSLLAPLRNWLRDRRGRSVTTGLRRALAALFTTDALPATSRQYRRGLARDLGDDADCAGRVQRFQALLERDLRSETRLLEQGLNTYARQLAALDRHLRHAESERSETIADHDAMSAHVRQHVGDIRQAVSGGAAGVPMQRVESRLAHIVDTLRNYSRRQHERVAAAESEADALRGRLQEAEAETAELRRRLVEERSRGATDTLTGVPNRMAFEERFSDELSRQQRTRRTFALVVADIDHFKRVNDIHGHLAGDRILVAVAETLRAALRTTDMLARYGGEEFVALLPETDADAARESADRLLEAVRRLHPDGGGSETVPVTISAGVTEVQVGDDMTDAFERADHALYDAKRAGRDRIAVRLR